MTIRTALGACLMLACGTASAASLFVRPTTVYFARGESAASVTVTNSGDAPVTAQLRLFAWDQTENQDKLEPTGALVASPPMLEIPPGKSQTIRLVRVMSVPPKAEESYRLIVDEIPDPKARAEGSSVVVQLRYSVPVFINPKPSEPANTAVRATLSGGELVLDIANRGKTHAQISNVRLAYADGSSNLVGAGLLGYVLPSKQRQWKLDLPAATPTRGAPKRVQAQVNGKELLVAL